MCLVHFLDVCPVYHAVLAVALVTHCELVNSHFCFPLPCSVPVWLTLIDGIPRLFCPLASSWIHLRQELAGQSLEG